MWFFKSKQKSNSSEEVLEEYMDRIRDNFIEKIENREKAGKLDHKPDYIPIALFYVAKSQKESAKTAEKLNVLTLLLLVLTSLLVILTFVLIFQN